MRGNPFTKLDVSKNLKLEDLGIDDTPLETIDLSANVNLRRLTCGWSSIKSLDLSNNPKLEDLQIDESKIETIDVSNNPELNCFSCQGGKISKLDLTNNPKMQYLDIQFLPLKELDLSNCEKLVYLIENGDKSDISDRQAWNNAEGDEEAQLQVPLNCKLIY